MEISSRFAEHRPKRENIWGLFREGGHAIFDSTTNKNIEERVYKWENLRKDLEDGDKNFFVRILKEI